MNCRTIPRSAPKWRAHLRKIFPEVAPINSRCHGGNASSRHFSFCKCAMASIGDFLMLRRILFSVFLLAAFAVLAGCGGPSAEGINQRRLASERVGVMNAQISFDQARQAFEVGQFEKSLREINAAITRYPNNPEYYILQGRIYLETKRLEQAIGSFEQGITRCDALAKAQEKATAKPDTAPDRPAAASPAQVIMAEGHYYSGIVYQRWSDDQRAYEEYSQAFQIESTKVDYLLAAAESLVALGRFDEAK